MRVLLPRVGGDAPVTVPEWTKPEAPEAPQAAPVLLVEDDRAAREMLRDYLEWRGFRVLTAANGPEALETFRKEAEGVDVVVTDWIMPGMSGPEPLEPGAPWGSVIGAGSRTSISSLERLSAS